LRNNPNPFAVKTGIGPESGSECEVYEKAEIHPSTKGLVDTMKVG
jgi:hypothetical protein